MFWFSVPAFGFFVGVANVKVPGTEAFPPDKVESASVCPYVIDEAVGQVVTVGVALFVVTEIVPVTVL